MTEMDVAAPHTRCLVVHKGTGVYSIKGQETFQLIRKTEKSLKSG